ncbi:MAG: dephospho-CoA kinase [Paludibacteraceae bacterium]|nr:dephospho-CoA kinase [Paludibacteraceae bacterium]
MVIGVTGGIGSGKSYVCRLLEIASLPVFYSDDVAKRLVNDDPDIKKSITELFGEGAYIELRSIDEKKTEERVRRFILDRKFISEKIFNDSTLREKMNAIVHPAVFKAFEHWKEEQNSNVVVVESALLFESGMSKYVDKVIVVSAPEEVKIARLQKRDSLSEAEIRQRMKSQCSDAERLRQADYIITNGLRDDINAQVFKVLVSIQNQIFDKSPDSADDSTSVSYTHNQTSPLK